MFNLPDASIKCLKDITLFYSKKEKDQKFFPYSFLCFERRDVVDHKDLIAKKFDELNLLHLTPSLCIELKEHFGNSDQKLTDWFSATYENGYDKAREATKCLHSETRQKWKRSVAFCDPWSYLPIEKLLEVLAFSKHPIDHTPDTVYRVHQHIWYVDQRSPFDCLKACLGNWHVNKRFDRTRIPAVDHKWIEFLISKFPQIDGIYLDGEFSWELVDNQILNAKEVLLLPSKSPMDVGGLQITK